MGRRVKCGACEGGRSRGDGGAVAVEFALILPVLVMLMLGIVTFGLAFNEKLALTNGVREGGRFGASLPSHAGWESEVVDRTRQVLFSSGDPSGLVICSKLVAGTGDVKYASLPTPCLAGEEPPMPAGVDAGDCVVKVWAKRPAALNIMVAKWDIDLTAQSVSFYQRTPCGPEVSASPSPAPVL